jgi:proteasome beta subunit
VGSDSYGRQLPAAYLNAGTSSFTDFVTAAAPELLPSAGTSGGTAVGTVVRDLPHGTTIVAAAFYGGVVMAGDSRPHDLAARHPEGVPKR